MAKKVLFKVLSWGLGHATRSLPLIREFITEKYEVTVASRDRSLELLRIELGDSAEFIELPDISTSVLRDCPWVFLVPKVPVELTRLWKSIRIEHGLVEELVRKNGFDLIISDTCWGAFSTKIPSFLLCHHLKPFWFGGTSFLQGLNEAMAWRASRSFTRILIPDYEEDSLSGELSHNFSFIRREKVEYIGILSDFTRKPAEEDIDYLISISGAEPQKSAFVRQILKQVENLQKKTVVLLGEPERYGENYQINNHVEVVPYAKKPQRDDFMNRAKIVISRPGYTTIMDIVETGKRKVVFIPTRNHTEQEYLAKFHRERNKIYSVKQRKLKLLEDIARAKAMDAFCNVRADARTNTSIYNFKDIVLNCSRRPKCEH